MSTPRPGHRFRVRVEQHGDCFCLDLPGQLSRTLRAPRDAGLPVRVLLGGITFDTELECRDDGLHRLVLPAKVWKELYAAPGDLLVGRISSRAVAADD